MTCNFSTWRLLHVLWHASHVQSLHRQVARICIVHLQHAYIRHAARHRRATSSATGGCAAATHLQCAWRARARWLAASKTAAMALTPPHIAQRSPARISCTSPTVRRTACRSTCWCSSRQGISNDGHITSQRRGLRERHLNCRAMHHAGEHGDQTPDGESPMKRPRQAWHALRVALKSPVQRAASHKASACSVTGQPFPQAFPQALLA